jgi:hypothetical protein
VKTAAEAAVLQLLRGLELSRSGGSASPACPSGLP